MKLMQDIEAKKLSGSFYTPPRVVDLCLQRVREMRPGIAPGRILEPSAGDGAFIRGISRLSARNRLRKGLLTCVELNEVEGTKCHQELHSAGLTGEVFLKSFFQWATQDRGQYDVVIGNPPFVRYQFVPEDDRWLAEWLLRMRGHELQGVSNYWIPFVLLSLDLLREGGMFSLVLPSELLATVSAGQIRSELIRNFASLRVDLFPRETFPDILQDVLVVSGVRSAVPNDSSRITLSENAADGTRTWSHEAPSSTSSWTQYLLSNEEWKAYQTAAELSSMHAMGQMASVSVAIVTGANDFFTVDDATLRDYGLAPWALPLLARTAESPGIVFTKKDHVAALKQGKKCWLLDFGEDKPNPQASPRTAEYLNRGEAQELPKRYKCGIREPWYRVPHIQRGALMMAKRSHQHHRLLLNKAGVFTTDTIYRGDMLPAFRGREKDVIAGFHNSLTMLSAEIEGRTYGGGVLELVPSEISRLIVPLVPAGDFLRGLDDLSRETGGQRDADDKLIAATDHILANHVDGYAKLLPLLMAARQRLRDRRFSL
jgi:adenine-specific DNA-methyltransferase